MASKHFVIDIIEINLIEQFFVYPVIISNGLQLLIFCCLNNRLALLSLDCFEIELVWITMFFFSLTLVLIIILVFIEIHFSRHGFKSTYFFIFRLPKYLAYFMYVNTFLHIIFKSSFTTAFLSGISILTFQQILVFIIVFCEFIRLGGLVGLLTYFCLLSSNALLNVNKLKNFIFQSSLSLLFKPQIIVAVNRMQMCLLLQCRHHHEVISK